MNSQIVQVATIGSLIALAVGGYAYVENLYDRVDSFSLSLERSEEVLARNTELQEELERLEASLQSLRSNLDGRIEAQITSQTEQRFSEIELQVDVIQGSLPQGVTLSNTACVPLNERVTVRERSSVEFCDSSLIFSVGEITRDEDRVDVGRYWLNVPNSTDQGYSPCTIHAMSIDRSNPESPTVDVRANCPE